MLKTPGHKQSVSNLMSRGPTDLVLVSDCGAKVASHSLLIALNSPKMAQLLSETETNTAISLPFPISIVSALASALISRQKGKGVEGLEEAAAFLGIQIKVEAKEGFKVEETFEEEQVHMEYEDGEVKEEAAAEESKNEKPSDGGEDPVKHQTDFKKHTKKEPLAAMVKEEPRQHHQVAMEEEQQEQEDLHLVIDNISGATEQYGAEGDDGEYDQGVMVDASMVGANGNKDLGEVLEEMVAKARGDSGKWMCLQCGKVDIRDKTAAKNHAESHLSSRLTSLPCHFCQKVFKSRNSLASHHSRKHGSKQNL